MSDPEQLPQRWMEQVELFSGAWSEALCRVYARLDVDSPDITANWQLTGTLTGPTCAYGETLPATFRFVDRGPGGPPLAEALVPEPNAWTPEMPHLYQAVVELREGATLLARTGRMFGIRPLGAAGAGLRYAGKGWVLRGVHGADSSLVDLAAWHAAETALVVSHPGDDLCEAASRDGVLIVAELSNSYVDEIHRLSRWPAVGLVSLSASAEPLPRAIARNLLVGRRLSAESDRWDMDPRSDVVFVELGASVEPLTEFMDCPLPVIAVRPADAFSNVETGRSACDRLQRDLARRGQFAGYIV